MVTERPYSSEQGRGGGCYMIPHRSDRAAGDPRLSLEERYGDHAGYVTAVTKAAQTLQQGGFLLPGNAQAAISAAQASNVLQ